MWENNEEDSISINTKRDKLVIRAITNMNSALSKDLNALMLQEDDIAQMAVADAIGKKIIIETSRSGTR